MEHLSLKCLLAQLTGKGHAVPRCTDTEIKRTVPVSQRLRSKDKARYNRWKQTDGGKQENNDTMSASMTGSQLSTPVVCLGSFLQESQQNAGCVEHEGACLHASPEVMKAGTAGRASWLPDADERWE